MNKLRVLIIDDEPLARAVLREMLADRADIEIAAECANGFEAVKAASETQPDLLLLDVQMPKLDGFEVLELIGPNTAVIFITAYDTYAMRAFEVHAVDYLQKPFTPDRLNTALDRARQRIGTKGITGEELSAAARGPQSYAERIVTRDGAKVHIIPTQKLDFIEAQEDYIALRTEGKTILKQQTISSIETILDPTRFVRIHRSYILNIERLVRVEPYGKNSKLAVLTTGDQLPISRTGHERLTNILTGGDRPPGRSRSAWEG
ncbi:MAG: response regulator transcription factor [Acidobacteria bacterium]|nr:response regulator transcription factor [Acidobacteriota bacterium]